MIQHRLSSSVFCLSCRIYAVFFLMSANISIIAKLHTMPLLYCDDPMLIAEETNSMIP